MAERVAQAIPDLGLGAMPALAGVGWGGKKELLRRRKGELEGERSSRCGVSTGCPQGSECLDLVSPRLPPASCVASGNLLNLSETKTSAFSVSCAMLA